MRQKVLLTDFSSIFLCSEFKVRAGRVYLSLFQGGPNKNELRCIRQFHSLHVQVVLLKGKFFFVVVKSWQPNRIVSGGNTIGLNLFKLFFFLPKLENITIIYIQLLFIFEVKFPLRIRFSTIQGG